jgi:hypothetical protein
VTWGGGTAGVTGPVSAANSLVGPNPGDRVGSGGVTALGNGNYLVLGPNWNGNTGAATWGDGTAGVTGPVDASNSLVGRTPGDQVGYLVTVLGNGNYVVRSPFWNGNRGAATWGDGTAGVAGPVDASNSLVGSSPNDQVGLVGVTALSNGNYVVLSANWNGFLGAATWGDGTAGVRGAVDAGNSLVGSIPGDQVGSDGVTALVNGDYVVRSTGWHSYQGAVTWGDGRAGLRGVVDAGNSLVGSIPGGASTGDRVGLGGVTALVNGNYVVHSWQWDSSRGAATWGDGTAGVTGTVDAGNSLVGSNPSDQVSLGGIVALSNGNYVVASPYWDGGGFNNARGAVTWGDGTAGVSGAVDAGNSLVGSHPGDRVGYGTSGFNGVTALANGNYVVQTPFWNGGRGAVTWGDGTVGVTGPVS